HEIAGGHRRRHDLPVEANPTDDLARVPIDREYGLSSSRDNSPIGARGRAEASVARDPQQIPRRRFKSLKLVPIRTEGIHEHSTVRECWRTGGDMDEKHRRAQESRIAPAPQDTSVLETECRHRVLAP